MPVMIKDHDSNKITFEKAYAIAKQHKDQIDNCTEYENAFVFGYSGDSDYIGGYGHTPVVIMKEDGRIASMPEFVADGAGKEVRSFTI